MGHRACTTVVVILWNLTVGAGQAVELPVFEPELLPGKMRSELLFRYVSFPFGPAHYLRFRFRVLTASRASSPAPAHRVQAVTF